MHTSNLNPRLLQTKQHFEILDGLRGVAAIAVVIYHFMEFAVPDYHHSFIAHGHLAVDFFFCLSGFVMAYAYDSRIEKLGFWSFFKLRLIRLHPLVLLGSVLGLLTFVFDPFSQLQAAYSFSQKVWMFFASCLLIPYQTVPERYFNFFHLNPPTWSLFWEYIANICYALFLFRFPNKLLIILLGIAAMLLCYESYTSGYLGVGWGGDNFWGGGIRIFFSFLAGMLVYRLNWIIRSKIGLIAISILLIAVFLIPFREASNWFVDPLVVIFYFPLLVALGSGAFLSNALRGICKFLGNISYPLYMIHYPILWVLLSYIEKYKPSIEVFYWLIPSGTMLLIVLSYLVLKIYDLPLRNYLRQQMKN